MSFGGFSFGSSSTTAQPAQPAAQGQGSVPSFSFTGPTPAATPAPASAAPASTSTFSFGAPNANTNAGSGQNPASTTAPAAAGGGLFGQQQQQQQQQPAQGGGLFGGGGMFGAKPAAPAPASASGGLFGATSTSNTAAGTGTNMFGQPQQSQTQTGGLFGSQTQQSQQPQQQQPQAGLFGQQSQSQSQSQPQTQGQGSSLFGSTTQPPAQGSNLFGSQSQTQSKPQGLQFGQSSTSNTTSNSTSGQGGMSKGTKFTDLPEQHQKSLEQLDAAFRQQKQLVYGTVDSQEDLGRAIGQVINDVKSAQAECTALELGLAPLRRACETLSLKFRSEEEDLQRLSEIWTSYRPHDGRPSSLRAGALRDFRKGYFRKVVQDSEERIPRYKKTVMELRRAVESLGHTSDKPSAQAIAQTIENHQNTIYTLAATVEDLEVRWNDVRDQYSQMYKDKTGSIRDPLDVAREKRGLPVIQRT